VRTDRKASRMEVTEDDDDGPCHGEAHARSRLYKRAVGRNTFGAWKLECGHVAGVANVIHCEGCGATLINCPSCAERGEKAHETVIA
jgi:hypothetical protein